jgi:pSer/pThr/pTyr-binding forkhead associated (FHA) protein
MSSEHSINGFMIACGMTGPLELDVEDREHGTVERRVYHQPHVIIGRMPAADLPLDDDQVSRRHAYLQVVGSRVYCVDLASRMGLRWDDGTYGSGWLDYGRRGLRVGRFVIRLRDGVPDRRALLRGEGPGRPPGAPHGARRLPRVALEFPGRPAQPPWRMNQTLTLIGRSPVCRVLLSGTDVSRFHCSLVRTPMGVWVVDLMGRKGTSINGRLLRSHLLGDGDEIEVGHYRICLRYSHSGGAHLVGRESSETADASETGPKPETEPAQAPDPLPTTTPTPPAARFPVPATHLMPAMPPLSLGPGLEMPTLPAFTPNTAITAAQVSQLLAGRPPEQAELAESLLVPLVHHFGSMQQQMFDQFQQVLVLLFQMFASMHREHMEVVREELAQIRRLNDEIQNLQARLDNPPAATPASPAVPTDRTPAAATTPAPATPPPKLAIEPEHATWSASNQASQLHLQLASRIAQVQKEREGRWQKLLKLVSGSSPGQPAATP